MPCRTVTDPHACGLERTPFLELVSPRGTETTAQAVVFICGRRSAWQGTDEGRIVALVQGTAPQFRQCLVKAAILEPRLERALRMVEPGSAQGLVFGSEYMRNVAAAGPARQRQAGGEERGMFPRHLRVAACGRRRKGDVAVLFFFDLHVGLVSVDNRRRQSYRVSVGSPTLSRCRSIPNAGFSVAMAFSCPLRCVKRVLAPN